jgi:hypothetical protein
MSRKLLLLGVLATLSSAAVQAQDYQFEVNGGLGFVTEDDGLDEGVGFGEVDSDLLGLSGTAYFEPVSTKGGPLAEAAFIQHASYATINLTSQNYDDGIPDIDTRSIAAQVVGASGVFLNLLAAQAEQGNDDADAFGFGVGYYVTDLSTIQGNFISSSEEDIEGVDVDVNTFSVAYRQLMMQQAPTTLAVNVNADFRQSDAIDDDAVSFGASLTLYPSDVLGLSVGFDHIDGDDYSENNLLLAADYFVQPNLRVGVEYLTGSQDDDNSTAQIDTDIFAFNAGVRF